MAVRDLSELDPQARSEVERYLRELEAGFCAVARDVALDALDDVRSHVLERLEPSSSAEQARSVLSEFGEPDEYAARLCAEVSAASGQIAKAPEAESGFAQARGTILGMPYDLKAPTPANIESRIWNPRDPRVFTPRLVGLGWSINFGALAVKAGLIRPDDEDEPFAAVPEQALWAALFVPVVVCGAVVIACAVSWNSLPARLPVHWGASGRPDGYASAAVALWPLIAFSVVPAGYAIWAFVAGRSKKARAVIVASATLLVVLSAGIVTATLAEANGVFLGWAWPWVVLACVLGVPFLMLLILSRIGHAREVRRDLGERGNRSARKGNES